MHSFAHPSAQPGRTEGHVSQPEEEAPCDSSLFSVVIIMEMQPFSLQHTLQKGAFHQQSRSQLRREHESSLFTLASKCHHPNLSFVSSRNINAQRILYSFYSSILPSLMLLSSSNISFPFLCWSRIEECYFVCLLVYLLSSEFCVCEGLDCVWRGPRGTWERKWGGAASWGNRDVRKQKPRMRLRHNRWREWVLGGPLTIWEY